MVAAFEKQKTTAEIAEILKTLYHGGNGLGSVSAWYAEDGIHPGLVDLFTRQARKAVQEKEKGSVLQKLKQELPAHKPAAPKKREPER